MTSSNSRNTYFNKKISCFLNHASKCGKNPLSKSISCLFLEIMPCKAKSSPSRVPAYQVFFRVFSVKSNLPKRQQSFICTFWCCFLERALRGVFTEHIWVQQNCTVRCFKGAFKNLFSILLSTHEKQSWYTSTGKHQKVLCAAFSTAASAQCCRSPQLEMHLSVLLLTNDTTHNFVFHWALCGASYTQTPSGAIFLAPWGALFVHETQKLQALAGSILFFTEHSAVLVKRTDWWFLVYWALHGAIIQHQMVHLNLLST